MDAIAHGLGHPLRRKMLVAFAETTPLGASPKEMAEQFREPLTNVSYHVRQLDERGLIVLVNTTPRRGALEHFYRASPIGRKALLVLDTLKEVAT